MTLSTKQFMAAVAIAAVAWHLGKRSGKTISAAPTNHGEIEQASDWWTYAGTW